MYLYVYNVSQMPLNYGLSVIKFNSVQWRDVKLSQLGFNVHIQSKPL